jgi:hypothetical protein
MSTVNVNRVVDASGGVLAPISSVMRNRIINGAMVIDQRNAGAAVTCNNNQAYAVDRFYAEDNSDGIFTVQQIADAPAGFINSLRATITTADSSLAGTQFAAICQQIEGYNFADFGFGTANAQTFTLSFWVKSSLTGTFGGSFRNSADNRCFPFTYTISSANTWEQKTVTVAGDTTGTWVTNNFIGLKVWFSLGAGATYSGTAGSWQSSVLVSATGAVSVIGTNSATFQVTGVQLEKGTQATSFEYRQYGQELALCQRYYIKYLNASGAAFGSSFNDSTTLAVGLVTFPVTMRVAPTALEQTGTASNYRVRRSGGAATDCSSVPAFASSTTINSQINFTVASGLTAGQGSILQASGADRFLAWSAEL